ncbi:MAG: biotin--[acetyl-CoA-carboxylase] ligase [Verrucomicrobiaceae bacterium]|nr:biotin--[acetyl-CoA-carboxylase] ligase [Verrucomicrobiaceae bacterium]
MSHLNRGIHDEIIRGWPAADRSRFLPDQFRHTPETGSTNDDLLAKARAGEITAPELLATDYQTSGRGRRGDRWEAAPGRNLLFSLALPLDSPRETWSRLPQLTASLVGSAIEDILGPGHQLQAKWPNDLLYQGQKLAGILVEITLKPHPVAIVGVGVNVNLRADELPPALRALATSLYEIAGYESNRWFLLGLIVQGFLRHHPERLLDFQDTLAWITARDLLHGRRLQIRSGREDIVGTASGIGPRGELLLRKDNGHIREIVSAEEIRWR